MAKNNYNICKKSFNSTELISGLLEQGESVCFTAMGPSMNPTIHSGGTVSVQPIMSGKITAGSILLFKQHGRLVLHRFIRYQRSGNLMTVADAALEGHDWVTRDDIIGVATLTWRGSRAKRVNTWSSHTYGLLRYYTRPLRRIIICMHRFLHPKKSS